MTTHESQARVHKGRSARAGSGDPFTRRYRLGDRIAVGGTAEVFWAELLDADGEAEPVVVKRVLPQFARDERFRKLFLEEAKLAASLSHPGIVRVLDHGVLPSDLGESCYIALEPVDGHDLGTLIQAGRRAERPMPLSSAALVAMRVAEALQFIHDHTSSEGTPLRIVHRDVSPQNILVSYQGAVKLTDFGIAKSAVREERTVDGTLRGKIDYMAPEQALAGATIDQRADIFALGCVLFELIEGLPPFRDASELATLDRLRRGDIRRQPDALEAPPPLRSVLRRALAADPDERYNSSGEMAADLEAFVASLTPRPCADDLGQWAREVDEATRPKTSTADDAVARLLGSGPPEDSSPFIPIAELSRPNTSVFASSGVSRAVSGETAVAPPPLPAELFDAPAEPAVEVIELGPITSLDAPRSSSGLGHPVAIVGNAADASQPRAGRRLLYETNPGVNTAEVDAPAASSGSRRLRIGIFVAVGVAAIAGATGWIMWALDRDDNAAAAGASAASGRAPRVLAVSATPQGAELLVDGRSRGELPQRVVLPEESVTLTIRRRGYRAVERVLQRDDTRRSLHVALTKLPDDIAAAASAAAKDPRRTTRRRRRRRRVALLRGSGYLTINTLPWSRVYLDGRFIGNTPLVKKRVRAGSRRVQLRTPRGGVRRSFVAVIPRGSTRSYTFDLTK